jgi:3-dehydroquinate synthase
MAEQISVQPESEAATVVPVALSERRYDVVIGDGLIDDAGRRLKALLPAARWAVISDENVARLHLPRLAQALQRHGVYLGEIVVPPGEASKCFATLDGLCQRLLTLGVERGDCVLAFGGGVVGDLAGFAASILRRGVHLVQLPTSLLAQVDSAIGGKTGIDTPQGKNLIGSFYQPALVLADLGVLETLPERELKAGYAEIVKYGLIADAEFFAWLERVWRKVLLAGPTEQRRRAIATSASAKADVVAEDEFERSGARALLNLGHTFGHALEAFAGYSERLLHGEAIAIGMALAFRYSAERGLCAGEDAARVKRHFDAVGLPTAISQIPGGKPTAAEMLALMAQDKKVKGGKLNLILARGIGAAFVEEDVAMDQLTDFLQRECGG